MSFLVDASCGQGIAISTETLQPPQEGLKSGYAGGIGPATIASVLTAVAGVSQGQPVWVDMESSLRTLVADSKQSPQQFTDKFSVEKCFQCIQIGITSFGLPVSRFTLLSI